MLLVMYTFHATDVFTNTMLLVMYTFNATDIFYQCNVVGNVHFPCYGYPL